jgi:hypothetical protein
VRFCTSVISIFNLTNKEIIWLSEIMLMHAAAEGRLQDVIQLTTHLTSDIQHLNLVLREACMEAQWGSVKWMVEHTAVDVSFTDLRAENSALHNVVWCSKNRGHTPLHIACMEQHGVK